MYMNLKKSCQEQPAAPHDMSHPCFVATVVYVLMEVHGKVSHFLDDCFHRLIVGYWTLIAVAVLYVEACDSVSCDGVMHLTRIHHFRVGRLVRYSIFLMSFAVAHLALLGHDSTCRSVRIAIYTYPLGELQ